MTYPFINVARSAQQCAGEKPNEISLTRRRLMRAGIGASLGALAPTFMAGGRWSLLAPVHAQNVNAASSSILDMWVSSRSGRVAFAEQRVTVLPFASFIWLVQQMHWRTRGFDVANSMPGIRALTPKQAQAFYNRLILSYVGTAVVAGTAWHKQIAAELKKHMDGFIPPIDRWGQEYTPTKPGDGLYPIGLNEALDQAAENGWSGHTNDNGAGSLKKKLEDAAARGGVPSHSPGVDTLGGLTPVIDFWRGEIYLFGGSAVDGWIGGFGGPGYPYNGGLDFSPAGSGDADIASAAAEMGTALTVVGGLSAGTGVGLFVLGIGLGLLAGAAGIHARVGYDKNQQDEKDKNKPKPGNSIPSGPDGSLDSKPTRVRVPTPEQMTWIYVNDFRYRRVGLDRSEYDLSKSENLIISIRQIFDQLTGTMGWSLAFKQSAKGESAKEDDTGLLFAKWIQDNIMAQTVPSGSGAYDPGKDPIDTLGKKPSIPPRAVALSYNIQSPVMDSGTTDLTVQMQLLR